MLNWNKTLLLNDVDRAHRGTAKTSNEENRTPGPPPIFVKFSTWRASQNVLTGIIKCNKDGGTKVTAHQMYSKQMQERYNHANKVRRQLKEEEDTKNWSTYVRYPGILMVKKSTDGKYETYVE